MIGVQGTSNRPQIDIQNMYQGSGFYTMAAALGVYNVMCLISKLVCF